jgi:hypothetical protein
MAIPQNGPIDLYFDRAPRVSGAVPQVDAGAARTDATNPGLETSRPDLTNPGPDAVTSPNGGL